MAKRGAPLHKTRGPLGLSCQDRGAPVASIALLLFRGSVGKFGILQRQAQAVRRGLGRSFLCSPPKSRSSGKKHWAKCCTDSKFLRSTASKNTGGAPFSTREGAIPLTVSHSSSSDMSDVSTSAPLTTSGCLGRCQRRHLSNHTGGTQVWGEGSRSESIRS